MKRKTQTPDAARLIVIAEAPSEKAYERLPKWAQNALQDKERERQRMKRLVDGFRGDPDEHNEQNMKITVDPEFSPINDAEFALPMGQVRFGFYHEARNRRSVLTVVPYWGGAGEPALEIHASSEVNLDKLATVGGSGVNVTRVIGIDTDAG